MRLLMAGPPTSACAPAEAIMRALVDVGPVVAYMFVLPPSDPSSFYFYDSQFGRQPTHLGL